MALDIKAKVDTIAILMLENRSFDHMFSFLSLDPANPRTDMNGITSLRKRDYPNTSKARVYYPWVTNDDPLVADLPHGRDLVDVQLKGPNPTANSAITMRGFVEAYRQEGNIRVVMKNAAPMAVQKRPWMMDYFAKRHLVCTQWFAPLPTDTQPNRLMALSGFTNFDTTKPRVIDQKPLIYHWLSDRGIPWRVYRSGLPFEMLIKSMWNDVFDDREFRNVNQLANDVAEEGDATFPRVIFMEPAFADSPIRLGYQPNDDHPPLQIAPGQQFMREMYMALNANPKRWAKTVMVITYDEHGGFYDHVTPLNVTTHKPAGARWSGGTFKTTGVRVPAIIASPLVKGGSVYGKPLDHTSILQFIASLLGDGKPYSDDLAARATAGIGSVADALNRDEPRSVIPKPPENAPPVQVVGTLDAMAGDLAAGIAPKKGANAKAFEDAARQLVKQRPADVKAKYPELIHWDKT